MKTMLYGTYNLQAGNEIDYNMTVEYYLTEEYLCKRYSKIKKYGILINKLCDNSRETKHIRDIFYRLCDAEEFIDILIRNKVTPITLEDVIKDYISQKVNG